MARRKKKGKKKVVFIVFIILVLLGAGAYYLWTQTDVKEEIEKKVVKKLKIVDEDSKSRPIAVMINNNHEAWPHAGLQDAYITYEIVAEGGITRLMALFKDQDTAKIGSVRSSRPYYLDYALENDAIYVHHGQSPQAQSDFSKLGVDRVVVDNTKTGWRDNSLKVATEHRLFTSIEKLNSGLGKIRTTRNNDLLLNYSIDELDLSKMENAQSAQSVSIKYSSSTTSSYKYDSENQVYKRFVNDKAHTDYVTKEQYTFKNIITYQVGNYTINDGENKGRQELENIGSGTGYFISNGYAVPIKWEKDSRASQTKYYFENGEELIVNDGNTFIQIQPKGQKLVIE